jgi:hypothetical protein
MGTPLFKNCSLGCGISFLFLAKAGLKFVSPGLGHFQKMVVSCKLGSVRTKMGTKDLKCF